MNKLLLFQTGGTISMRKNPATGAVETRTVASDLVAVEPRISELAEISLESIANIDSTNMDRRHWERIVDGISTNYDRYDGFLVTSGTNTLAYASSALSFALPNIGKPVILTGAQIPADAINSDARNNLVNAVQVATLDLSGVFVVFGSKIIRGCRAKKVNESALDAFATFNQRDFGKIGVGIKLNYDTNKRQSTPLAAENGFDDNIVCLTLIPGLPPRHVVTLVDNGVRAIVLRGFGSGDVPSALFDALGYARENEVPVVVTTQCPGGATQLGLNDVGRKALEEQVIQAFDMSMESMSTKLMWLLRRQLRYDDIIHKMQTNLVGELAAQPETP